MITTEQINAIAAKIETLGMDETTIYETHPCVSPFGPADGCSNSLQANLSVLRQQYPTIHFTIPGQEPAKQAWFPSSFHHHVQLSESRLFRDVQV